MMTLTLVLPAAILPASANSGDRTLYLYYTHTKETGRFTFKRNGRFDQKVLGELNVFLRDWRRNEPAKMDPALFDLIWAVYNEVGATQPIHIVSAYRSPATNKMLRASSSGVAENSQHTRGHAMDFFIPGVPLPRLREVAMRHQVGGVGYYPTSGSPFVHLDTGNVRAWPRMTRAQLEKVFPDGRTLHLPSDGKVLSEQGRRYAQAEWEKCRMVPCNAAAGQRTLLASSDAPAPAQRRTLIDLFTGGGQDQAQQASARSAGAPAPAAPAAPASAPSEPATIAIAALEAPIPMARLAARIPAAETPAPVVPAAPEIPFQAEASDPLAPMPAMKSAQMLLATAPARPAPVPAAPVETAIGAIAALDDAPIPAPRIHMTPRPEPQLVTAYLPPIKSEPGARRALEMILSRDTTATFSAATPAPAATAVQKPAPVAVAALPAFEAPGAPEPEQEIRTASLGGAQGAIDAIKGLFESTWNAVTGAGGSADMATALQAVATSRGAEARIAPRQIALVAPSVVPATMLSPAPVSSASFAEIHDAHGYFDKETELGALTGRIDFEPEADAPRYDRFDRAAPMVLAAAR